MLGEVHAEARHVNCQEPLEPHLLSACSSTGPFARCLLSFALLLHSLCGMRLGDQECKWLKHSWTPRLHHGGTVQASPHSRCHILSAILLTFHVVRPHTIIDKYAPHVATPAHTSKSDPDAPFDWSQYKIRYPIKSYRPLPTNKPVKIPPIQAVSFPDETASQRKIRLEQLSAVQEAFVHTWNGYKSNAWMHDEVKPISGGSKDPFGGWAATLVDTLDTLWIMGMTEEFETAIEAAAKVDFTKCALDAINVFETTIRYLGGYLAAYDISGGKYKILLDKAVEVADMLMIAFDTPNHMPATRWNWRSATMGKEQWAPTWALMAEQGSLSLEFTRLSQLTGNPRYFDAVQRIMDSFVVNQNKTKLPGLWPVSIDPSGMDMTQDSLFTLGGMADSTYEYLPKQWILLEGRLDDYKSMYLTAIEAVKSYLIFEPLLPPSTQFTSTEAAPALTPLILGTMRTQPEAGISYYLQPEGQHLTCFAGGMFALGARALADQRTGRETAEDLRLAAQITNGCLWSYANTVTGIGPEIFHVLPCRRGRAAVSLGAEPDWEGETGNCTWDRTRWLAAMRGRQASIRDSKLKAWLDTDVDKFLAAKHLREGFTEVSDARYILRPETIEAVFMMWRVTGDPVWRTHAWTIFQAINKWTRTDIAYAAMADVTVEPTPGAQGFFDSMESFWTAETLKYFYLVFAEPDVVSLDDFVLNTEAHPLKRGK
ncbi:hypothetical protein MRB53_039414 [Persea americana]|nr:hypothetical protein MRB53_039414 [Persea americana]